MPKKVLKNKSSPISLENNQDITVNNEDILKKKEDITVNKDTTKKVRSKKNKNTLSPIIKWSGGKSDEIKNILEHLPNMKDINTYIEPFIGGGALYFYLNHHKNVINDVHNELIAFYKAIQNGKLNEIKEFMNKHPNTEETYYKVRDDMTLHHDLDIAKRFYYLRKTCFRGMLRYNKKGGFNIPFGKYKSINYDDLDNKEYENILKNTEIYNNDFSMIFDKYNDENNFMFLDPPYDSVFTDYGYCKFGKEEHKKLAEYFKSTQIKCLMVIGKTDFISELYNGYIVSEFDKKYKFKIHSNRIGDEINTKHLIIKNF